MAMKLSYTWGALVGCTLVSAAFANGDVIKQTQNSSNWAMQAGDMYNQRYSKLKQINTENVKNLQVAWTFSTGVLRGHEGSPAGDRRHDVHPHAVPQQGVRDRSRRRRRSSGSTSRSRTRP